LKTKTINEFKEKEMKNCANCGQLVAEGEGYKMGFLHTDKAFCCENCYEVYKGKHKITTTLHKIIAFFCLIVFLIFVLSAILSNSEKKNDNNNPSTEQVNK
jgi:hypothetical protein